MLPAAAAVSSKDEAKTEEVGERLRLCASRLAPHLLVLIDPRDYFKSMLRSLITRESSPLRAFAGCFMF